MKKMFTCALIISTVTVCSWFGVQQIEANTKHPDLVYDKISKSFYLQGDNCYANQSLEEKFLTMQSINAHAEQHTN